MKSCVLLWVVLLSLKIARIVARLGIAEGIPEERKIVLLCRLYPSMWGKGIGSSTQETVAESRKGIWKQVMDAFLEVVPDKMIISTIPFSRAPEKVHSSHHLCQCQIVSQRKRCGRQKEICISY